MFNIDKINTIKSLNIDEYGLYSTKLSNLIEQKENPEELIIALNNADTDGVLLQLLFTNEKEVFDGAKYLASAIGVNKITLNIPEFYENKNEIDKIANKNKINVEYGIVDCRKHENDLIVHIVTVYKLAKALSGIKDDNILVSINGEQLQSVSPNITLNKLVGDVKGVRTSYIIRNKSELNIKIKDALITNGMIELITNDTCVVSLVAAKLLADRYQSCGKCVFCREGLLQLEAMTKDITNGYGKEEYIALSEEIGDSMTYSTMCSLGQNGSLLLLSALKAFPEEFNSHIKKKKCLANFCKAFKKYYIDPETCIGCTKCMDVCPCDSIDGAQDYIHIVFDNTCSKCGKCLSVCPSNSIHVTTETVPPLPYKMMRVGRFKKF